MKKLWFSGKNTNIYITTLSEKANERAKKIIAIGFFLNNKTYFIKQQQISQNKQTSRVTKRTAKHNIYKTVNT